MSEWRYLVFVLWTGVCGHFSIPRNINTTEHLYVFHETIQADNDAAAHEYTLILPKGYRLDLMLFDASKANLTAQGLSCENLREKATWSHTLEPPRGHCRYNKVGQYGELYKCSGTFSSFGKDKLYTLAICSHNNNGIRVTDFELLTEEKDEHYDIMVIGILLGSIFLLLLVFFLVFFAMRKCSSAVLYHPEKKTCQISSHSKIPPGQTETEA
ncbi:uncharacterized protein [Haliotis asinina]|uniref:uncharacterized protein n=1 Tax=Haliotis asinina TaxID=109174 RepID=UPI0035321C46